MRQIISQGMHTQALRVAIEPIQNMKLYPRELVVLLHEAFCLTPQIGGRGHQRGVGLYLVIGQIMSGHHEAILRAFRAEFEFELAGVTVA
ncbi:hypothetical protein DYI20_11555 [Auritidibacter ignavus]|nr:hypothetical protein DYI20_11555 [Auritidibacter ignavus]